jgi:hypothetical protein
LIACTFTCYICVLTMQSRNQFVVPPILLREHCRYFSGKIEKVGRATVFLYWHHQFDLALHMMSFPHCIIFLIKKKFGENLQDIFFFSWHISNCMSFHLISQFFVRYYTLLRYIWEFITIICQVFSCIRKSRIASW